MSDKKLEKADIDKAYQIICDLAKENGYEITVEDIKKYSESSIKSLGKNKLDLDELGSVSGGAEGYGVCVIIGVGLTNRCFAWGLALCAAVGI